MLVNFFYNKMLPMEYRLNTRKPNLVSLILLISFPSFIAVVISPALPVIGQYFQISANYAQQTITLFLLGYAIGQLLYAPFSARFGRKVAVYWGLGIYFLGCFLALGGIYSHLINLLLLGRFIMALGSAAGMVLSYTFINDFYYPHQARPVVSYTILSYAFMPSIGVLVGGYLTTKVSWIACFYFFLLYGLIVFLGTLQLPETLLEKNPYAMKIKQILSSYVSAFKNLRLILFSLAFAFLVTTIYTAAAGAPYITIHRIGISPALYGLLMLIPYGFQFLGAIIAGRLNQYLHAYLVMSIAYGITSLGALFFFSSFLFNWINLFTLLISLALVMFAIPILTSNASVMAVSEYPDKSSGSGIMSFIVMSASLISVLVYSLFPISFKLLLPIFFMVNISASLFFFLIARFCYRDTSKIKK